MPDPIKHVVVLMLENHSFDQMLGGLKAEFPEMEGVDLASPGTNDDDNGQTYTQAVTGATTVKPDPMHETADVLKQLDNDNGGFVLDYATTYPDTTPAQRQQIMGYYAPGTLPALHALAREFTVCDQWYSSVPGPTWANRFFAHSGTSLGRVIMPAGISQPALYLGYDQDTVYDRLNERGVSWAVYYGDIPHSLVMGHQRRPENAKRHHHMSVFYGDAAGPEENFPAYSFIEPSYNWPGQNDDHPPHPTDRAQELIAGVYNALRANDALWQSTLLVVLYDEHGGFYDAVSPPDAVNPDGHTEEYTFDRLGVRVPAVLVSPWVKRAVCDTVLDHTSLLKYLTDKWGLGRLTDRVDRANSFADVIGGDGTPRATPASVPSPVRATAVAAADAAQAGPSEPLNEHQDALIDFTEVLEQETHGPVPAKAARTAALATGSKAARISTAKARVEAFLAQKKAEVLGG